MTRWKAFLAALKGGAWLTTLGGVLSIAVTVGALTLTQETAIQGVAQLVPTVAIAVTALVHAFTKTKAIRLAARHEAAEAQFWPGPRSASE